MITKKEIVQMLSDSQAIYNYNEKIYLFGGDDSQLEVTKEALEAYEKIIEAILSRLDTDD